jgi:hypothetical protein
VAEAGAAARRALKTAPGQHMVAVHEATAVCAERRHVEIDAELARLEGRVSV